MLDNIKFAMAKKLGMTQIYNEHGVMQAVTVLEIDTEVCHHKTKERDGYNAVVVAYDRKKHGNKPQMYLYNKLGYNPRLKEFRTDNLSDLSETTVINAENFIVGDHLDIRGVSKGKGFAGAVKRHNFKTNNASHGNSLSHRTLGSTGQCQDPGKVIKGKKMAGQLGNVYKSSINLKVVRIDSEENVIFVLGSVPGPKGQYVSMRISKRSKI